MVPDGWAQHTLKDCLSKIIDYRGKSVPKAESGIPLITARNVRNGVLDFSEAEFIAQDALKAWVTRGIPRSGDVIFTTEAPLGNAALFPSSGKYVVGQRVVVLQPNATICNNVFLMYYLLSPLGQGHVQIRSTGSTALGIKQTELRKVSVLLPSLPEQQKIAAILSMWDGAIELTEKLIAAKQKRKQALVQQLLTGKVRFAEFVKSKQSQRTPIGDMPTDWKKHRLGKVVEKVKRKNHEGECHVLTASGEHGLVDQREFFNRSVAGADLSGYYLLKRGEFAYNRSAMKGYPFGAIKRLNRYEQGVLSTLYICFGITDECCDSNFLCHFFEARLLDQQLRGVTQVGGRAHGLLNITDGDFYSMSVVLPSIEEQRKIAAVLDAQDLEIGQLRSKFDALTQQKTGLMQQLLTGKVRVDTR